MLHQELWHGGRRNENEAYCHDFECDGCIDDAKIRSKLIVHSGTSR